MEFWKEDLTQEKPKKKKPNPIPRQEAPEEAVIVGVVVMEALEKNAGDAPVQVAKEQQKVIGRTQKRA